MSSNILAGLAGITSDANSLVNFARNSAQRHLLTYNEDIPVEMLVQRLCDMKQGYTQYGGKSYVPSFPPSSAQQRFQKQELKLILQSFLTTRPEALWSLPPLHRPRPPTRIPTLSIRPLWKLFRLESNLYRCQSFFRR